MMETDNSLPRILKTENASENTSKRKKVEEPTSIENEFDEKILSSWTGDSTTNKSHLCPYLDTIDRTRLDFDFEKICSVTLSIQNVYACLICGKYFQGRGKNTPAYVHSIVLDHHVFINLHHLKFYCLPDNYEVVDNSLNDIKRVLDPQFALEDTSTFDTMTKSLRCLDGSSYHCGVMGLNNMKANDYVNVVVQALVRCHLFRDFFLFPENYRKCTHPLVLRTGELVRKLWCVDNYKAHISPHELLQTVVNTSNKRFQITKQGEAIEFLAWYLNILDFHLIKKNVSANVVTAAFQGKMIRTTRRMSSRELLNDAVEQERAQAAEDAHEVFDTKIENIPFLYLTLDVPPPPLYADTEKDDIIPQVPLLELFEKFNGKREQKKANLAHTYKIVQLPRFLILYIKRFTKNNFFVEKNPTIVKFPVKNLDLKQNVFVSNGEPTKYDLIANIVHSGKSNYQKGKVITHEKGTYRAQILHKANASGNWYEIEDLRISDISPHAISISEAYLQIYELVS